LATPFGRTVRNFRICSADGVREPWAKKDTSVGEISRLSAASLLVGKALSRSSMKARRRGVVPRLRAFGCRVFCPELGVDCFFMDRIFFILLYVSDYFQVPREDIRNSKYTGSLIVTSVSEPLKSSQLADLSWGRRAKPKHRIQNKPIIINYIH
jgi:hypothetical protein